MSFYRRHDGTAIDMSPYRYGYLASAAKFALDDSRVSEVRKRLKAALAHVERTDEELAAEFEREAASK